MQISATNLLVAAQTQARAATTKRFEPSSFDDALADTAAPAQGTTGTAAPSTARPATGLGSLVDIRV